MSVVLLAFFIQEYVIGTNNTSKLFSYVCGKYHLNANFVEIMVLLRHKITQIHHPRLLYLLIILLLTASCASQKAKLRAKQVDDVISTARTFMGTPYKYGGTTRAGMDCSALTIHAFKSINLSLPRSAEDQSNVGEKIKQKDLQPGDLVFFATGKRRRQVTHVGLVTDVNRKDVKFIHASTSLGVIENYLSMDYYSKRYRGARRIID